MDLSREYREMQRRNNTTVMVLLAAIIAIGCAALLATTLTKAAVERNWSNRVPLLVVFLLAAVLPFLLRRWRVSEGILTLLEINLFIALYTGLLFAIPDDPTVWVIAFVTGTFAGLFLSRKLVIYTVSLCYAVNLVYMFAYPQYLHDVLRDVVMVRTVAFLLFGMVMVLISDRARKMAGSNLEQMETIARQNEYKGRLIDNVRKLSDTITGLGCQVNLSVNESSRGLNEIAANTSLVAENARDTASSMASIMAGMKDFDGSVSEVRDIVSRAAELASRMKSTAADSKNGTGKLEAAMQAIKGSIEEVDACIREMQKNAGDISELMQQITDISDQTNLLSLNAAIESARAGEAGKGFAVVADEVRKLAEKSRTLSAGIIGIIGGNNQAVEKSVRSMNESLTRMLNGVSITRELVAASQVILESAGTSAGNMELISRQVNRQAELTRLFTGNIVSVAELARRTNEEIDRTVAVAEQISTAVEEITGPVNALAGEINQLGTLINSKQA